ncbi:methylamine utilization protein [Neptunicella marina]|uniref:methylamine utilization protein n=1 Tax=Neptunicella marina TaxID=2125989 RepID=UPI001888D0D8|nr:methylamine utilization protein [Neptunicella marina]
MKKSFIAQSVILVSSLFNIGVYAAELSVTVTDSKNRLLPNIVVYAEPLDKSSMPNEAAPLDHSAVMDQIHKQFVPHILVVQKSSWVNFPNSDSIKHHVYSFSPAKSFELRLYDGGKAKPIQFEKAGEVVLGCNIHDWMLGYIYSVDTPWFAKTNKQGAVTLDLPDGDYQLKYWSPLLQNADKDKAIQLTVKGDKQQTIQLNDELLPALADYENNDELTDY